MTSACCSRLSADAAVRSPDQYRAGVAPVMGCLAAKDRVQKIKSTTDKVLKNGTSGAVANSGRPRMTLCADGKKVEPRLTARQGVFRGKFARTVPCKMSI